MKIPGVYVDFKGDLTQLKRDFKKAGEEARKAGTDISNGMKNAVLPTTVTRSFNQLYRDLSKVARNAALTQADIKKLGISLDTDLMRNLRMSEQEFRKLQQRMLKTKATQQAERAFKSIARNANLSAMEVAALRLKMGDIKGSIRQFGTAMSSTMSRVGSAVSTATAAIAVLSATAGFLSKSFWDTGLMVARNTKAMEEIAGGSAEAAAEMEYLRGVADDLQQNFYTLLPTYKSFYAATKQSGMSIKDTRTIYEGATKAIATMGLTSEKATRVLKALEQMVSKGMRGVAEEVRQQMGESLPGAFGMFAKAVGVSEEKLNDLMEQGKLTLKDLVKFGEYMGNKYSGEIDAAVAASNKFAEAWTDLKAEMADSGFMESTTEALRKVTATFKDPEVKEGLKSLVKYIGETWSLLAKIGAWSGRTLAKFAPTRPVREEYESLLNQQAELRTQIAKMDQSRSFVDIFIGTGEDSAVEQLKAVEERLGAIATQYLKVEAAVLARSANLWTPSSESGALDVDAKDRVVVDRSSLIASDYVDSWHQAYLDKYEVISRALDYEIAAEEAAVKEKVRLATLYGGKYRDSWMDAGKYAKEAAAAQERATKMLYEDSETTFDHMKRIGEDAFEGLEDALVDFVETGKLKFDELATSILSDIARIGIRQTITNPLAQIFGGLFSAKGNVFSPAGVKAFATGGAFTNSIVSKPTMFAHGGGFGVMGEKGDEAILPLKRTSSGNLGVEASGAGAGPVNIQINIEDKTGNDIQIKETGRQWDAFNQTAVLNFVADGAINNVGGFGDTMRSVVGGR